MMSDNSKVKTQPGKRDRFEVEIDLFEFFTIIWKWKIIILLGTFIFGIISAVVSINLTKIYRANMVLKPGAVVIHDSGKYSYIDDAINIKAMISAGVCQNEIHKHLKEELKLNDTPNSFNFIVTIPKKSETIDVVYESKNFDQAKIVLNRLTECLRQQYNDILTHHKNNYEVQQATHRNDIEKLNSQKKLYEKNIGTIEIKIKELSLDIENLNNKTAELYEEKNQFLKTETNGNINSTLFYNDTIQQNMAILATYKRELYQLGDELLTRKSQVIKNDNEILNLLTMVNSLEIQKNNIKSVQVFRPPTGRLKPVRPKIKLNIILSLMTGLIAMIILAILLENIRRKKETVGDN